MPRDGPPDAEVVAAFGGRGSATALAGGQGMTFVAEGIVLKPVVDDALATWTAEVLSTVQDDGFRLSRPRPGVDGRWVIDGWCAFEWVCGRHRLRGAPWADVLGVCERFHHALTHITRPAILERRTDVFANAERIAWGELSADLRRPTADIVERLCALTRPVSASDQLVHGDFAGNLLFTAGEPPELQHPARELRWEATQTRRDLERAEPLIRIVESWHD